MQPVFENVEFKEKKEDIKAKVKAECITAVKAEDLSRVLSIDAFCSVQDRGADKDKLEFCVRAIFYFVYADKEAEIKKCECFSEYSGSADIKEDDAARKFYLTARTE